jgi:hypothetical protein
MAQATGPRGDDPEMMAADGHGGPPEINVSVAAVVPDRFAA